MPLNEALPAALDLAGEMNRQRHEAATQLSFCPFPGREGRLRSFRRGDVIWCWVRMAGQSLRLNLEEGLVLCGIVVFQARGMFEQVCLAGFIPVFLLVPSQRSLLALIVRH